MIYTLAAPLDARALAIMSPIPFRDQFFALKPGVGRYKPVPPPVMTAIMPLTPNKSETEEDGILVFVE